MKKLFISLVAIALSASCFAQGYEESISIIPRVGVNLSKITNGGYCVAFKDNTVKELDAKIRPAFACGVDAEYMFNSHFAMSAGVHYNQQGAKYDDYSVEYEDKTGYGASRNVLKLDYISVPIMAREYIARGFSVALGLQPSILIKTCRQWEERAFVIGSDGVRKYEPTEMVDIDYSDLANKFVLHMPVSISYEYQHVILDARYVYGLTHSFKKTFGKSNNTMLMFTVGYRFQL